MHRVVSYREREREIKKKRKRSVRVYTRTDSTHLVRAANATSCNLERSSMAECNEFNGALFLSSSSSSEEEEENALAHKPRERYPLLLLLFVVFFFPREVMKPPAQGRRVWVKVASIFSAFGGKKNGTKAQKKEERKFL